MAQQAALHRALSSLLPSHPIPTKLLATAESLYSLSKQRSMYLKQEEEIARAHVCAELACQKLRVALRLPAVRSGAGAPCKPATYKRLLGFLERTLQDVDPMGSPRKVGGGGGDVSGGTPVKSTVKRAREAREREVEGTPSKRQKTGAGGVVERVTPAASGRKPNAFLGRLAASGKKSKKQEREAPEYVLPAVKQLCKALGTGELVSHAYTGVCVILGLAGLWPPDNDSEEAPQDEVLALTVAVYLLTLTRMQDEAMTTEVFEAVCARSLALLEFVGPDQEMKVAIESWIGRINQEEWTEDGHKGEGWWDSVPEAVITAPTVKRIMSNNVAADLERDITVEQAVVVVNDEEQERQRQERRQKRRAELQKQIALTDGEDVLLPGLGTMMNDAVDYVNPDRRAQYKEWKKAISKMIETVENGGNGRSKTLGRRKQPLAA